MIDLMIFSLETMGMMWKRLWLLLLVRICLGVAPYRHEPAKKYRQSKPVSGGGSDDVTHSLAVGAYCSP